MKLQDKVVIITGGASGIGAASARLMAREGARVAIVDHDVEALRATVEGIEHRGGIAMELPVDVTVAADATNGVEQVRAAWGRIDVLMISCAISTGGTVATIDEEAWDETFSVNVKGCYLWAHAVLPLMILQGSGTIVLVGSQLVVASCGNNAAYIASKGAIGALAKTMAIDHAPQGIRVNALMPGVIDTPMSRRTLSRQADPGAARAAWESRHAMGRFGEAEEVARAALFLASDDSSFTTGSWLYADGGWSAM